MYIQTYVYTYTFFKAKDILEDFALTTNFQVHAETCLPILRSSHGCVAFLPLVVSNFLGRRSNNEKTNKTPG